MWHTSFLYTLWILLAVAGVTTALSRSSLSSFLHPSPQKGALVPDQHFLLFEKGVTQDDIALVQQTAFALPSQAQRLASEPDSFLFLDDHPDADFGGFLFGTFTNEDVAQLSSAHSKIIGVEPNQMLSIYEDDLKNKSMEHLVVQEKATWGLARISHHQNVLNSKMRMPTGNYSSSSYGGKGVTSYIIDTGINIHHPDFEGRAVWGTTIPKFDRDVDGNGHGTHCAGTIGSKTYGIAKNAILKAVKVLRSSGSGSLSDVTKGIQWVINDYTEALKKDKTTRATANMSLGGGTSRVLDMIVNAAVRAGIHFAVAAGNENAPACGTSPGRAELPVTVGATDVKDRRAEFSNYGECVDISAPGVNIKSTWLRKATMLLSGTSMATPHVTGVMTLWLSVPEWADLTPEEMKAKLQATASTGYMTDLRESPDYLLYSAPPLNATSSESILAKSDSMWTSFLSRFEF